MVLFPVIYLNNAAVQTWQCEIQKAPLQITQFEKKELSIPDLVYQFILRLKQPNHINEFLKPENIGFSIMKSLLALLIAKHQ